MGYESRLYIVEKSEIWQEVDTTNREVKNMRWGEVIAMFDLSKISGLPEAIKNYPATDTFIYVGENQEIDDCYGDPLKEIPIKDMADIIEKIAEDDEWRYRRFKPCIQLLRGFEENKWRNLVVLHYGH